MPMTPGQAFEEARKKYRAGLVPYEARERTAQELITTLMQRLGEGCKCEECESNMLHKIIEEWGLKEE
jgi:hypothetical protein